MTPLYKTTIVIWSQDDTGDEDLAVLCHDADEGGSYCSKQKCVLVKNPEEDADWDGTDFFDVEDDEEDGDIEDEDEEDDEENDDNSIDND